ncbi:hypothetical protein KCU66_g57, partial [Aureobasidium melanogenum]
MQLYLSRRSRSLSPSKRKRDDARHLISTSIQPRRRFSTTSHQEFKAHIEYLYRLAKLTQKSFCCSSVLTRTQYTSFELDKTAFSEGQTAAAGKSRK